MGAIELKKVSKDIVNRYAGSPLVIAKELDKYKLRYNKQRRGGLVLYTVRSKESKNPFKTVIKL